MGLFCHEYDHIIPYSKGGKTELPNCQILQTKLNREKSNRTDITFSELRNYVPPYSYSELEMDIIERAVYGDVRKPTLHDFVAGN
jgi:5-methylcytosine-specific restriction endonuclease McrA